MNEASSQNAKLFSYHVIHLCELVQVTQEEASSRLSLWFNLGCTFSWVFSTLNASALPSNTSNQHLWRAGPRQLTYATAPKDPNGQPGLKNHLLILKRLSCLSLSLCGQRGDSKLRLPVALGVTMIHIDQWLSIKAALCRARGALIVLLHDLGLTDPDLVGLGAVWMLPVTDTQ